MSEQIGIAIVNRGTLDEDYMYVESVDHSEEADVQEVKDGQNETKAVIYSNHKEKVSLTGTKLIQTTKTGTNQDNIIGKEITVRTMGSESVDMIAEKRNTSYKRGELTTVTVEGTRYPNLNRA